VSGHVTEPRLHTAISSSLVFNVISVHRLELCTTPTWRCGERMLHGSLKGDPGMPGFEQHGQHLAPQLRRRNLLEELQLAARGLLS